MSLFLFQLLILLSPLCIICFVSPLPPHFAGFVPSDEPKAPQNKASKFSAPWAIPPPHPKLNLSDPSNS